MREKSKAMKGLLALALLALAAGGAQGCAPYKLANGPIEIGYVALDDYKSAQETAISVIGDPNVPPSVKEAIRQADYAANPLDNPQASSIHILRDKLREYVVLKAEIEALEAAGREPALEKIAEGQLALAAVRSAITTAQPLIRHLIQVARSFRSF